ncbi:hypothetical protein [Poseidonocella sp. HB161398]|uniref:hypothetical protein n=1 Tax=Poseidonocella sp. HB161398 TaxID=2320855 RepID=UPI001109CB14|nr:hypothetical protein [Poseidonocella sp. HB161398]
MLILLAAENLLAAQAPGYGVQLGARADRALPGHRLRRAPGRQAGALAAVFAVPLAVLLRGCGAKCGPYPVGGAAFPPSMRRRAVSAALLRTRSPVQSRRPLLRTFGTERREAGIAGHHEARFSRAVAEAFPRRRRPEAVTGACRGVEAAVGRMRRTGITAPDAGVGCRARGPVLPERTCRMLQP